MEAKIENLAERLVHRLQQQRECDWIEFKDSAFSPHKIGIYTSALSNSARVESQPKAYLIWGVADQGAIVGTDLDPANERVGNQPFEFWLKGRLSPEGLGFRFRTETVDGYRVVLLEIDAAERVVTRFEGDPYIRIGQATPKLQDHPDRERRLMQALLESSFEDDWAMENVLDDEVFELLNVQAALEALRSAPAPTDPTQTLAELERYELVRRQGGRYWAITNRAALLFARELPLFGERYERKAPRVVFYRDDSRIATQFEQVGLRGYALALESMFDWIADRLPRSEHVRGARREEIPLYPLDALRELVANALIHQDFLIRGAGPMIEVFENRIEITNPGTPLGDVDRLLDEPPRSRNERLAALMRQMGFCEERGSGIDKVVFEAEVFQLPPPAFEIRGAGFVATMYAPRAFRDMTPDERTRATYQHACLFWAGGGRSMTNSTLRKRFGLPASAASQASRVIADALEGGVIKPADPSNRSRAHASYRPFWA